MDDDQFQGSLSVQGGNPEPTGAPMGAVDYPVADTATDSFGIAGDGMNIQSDAEAPVDLSAESDAPAPESGVADASPFDQAPVEQAPAEETNIDPEMSRRMDEVLGNIDSTAPAAPTMPMADPNPYAAPVAPVEPMAPVAPVDPIAPVSYDAPAAPAAPTMPIADSNPYAAPVAPTAPVVPEPAPMAAPVSYNEPTMPTADPNPYAAPAAPMATMPTEQEQIAADDAMAGQIFAEPVDEQAPYDQMVGQMAYAQEQAIPTPEQQMQQPMMQAPMAAPGMDAQAMAAMQMQQSMMQAMPGQAMPGQPMQQMPGQALAGEKKKPNIKVIAGIAVSIIVIIVSAIVIVMALNPDKPVQPMDVQGNAEDKPDINNGGGGGEETVSTQRIGNEMHGYVSVPEEWTQMTSGLTGNEFGYADADGATKVIMNSAAISETMTAKLFADGQFATAREGGMSQPQMASKKVGEYDGYEISYYSQEDSEWTYKFVFEAEDGRVHYVRVIATDNTNTLIESIPSSWSVTKDGDEGGSADIDKAEGGDAEDENR